MVIHLSTLEIRALLSCQTVEFFRQGPIPFMPVLRSMMTERPWESCILPANQSIHLRFQLGWSLTFMFPILGVFSATL